MRIVIAGGTGFLGTALAGALRASGHMVSVLTRSPPGANEVRWSPPDTKASWTAFVANADAVVNLAGAPIVGPRWTEARKRVLRESRVVPTATLARVIAEARTPPVFLSGSAVGFYGTRGDDPADETTPPGSDFLAGVCLDWERAAHAASAVTRLVTLRTGVVLARRGGALPQLARPFWFFAGGPIGSGRQCVSWIHLHDWVAMVTWAMTTEAVTGPLNVTAPNPVTNAELARTLGAAIHRPSFIRTPALPVRLALGEMADAAILGGQRVLPAHAQSLGFTFRHPELAGALSDIFA